MSGHQNYLPVKPIAEQTCTEQKIVKISKHFKTQEGGKERGEKEEGVRMRKPNAL